MSNDNKISIGNSNRGWVCHRCGGGVAPSVQPQPFRTPYPYEVWPDPWKIPCSTVDGTGTLQ